LLHVFLSPPSHNACNLLDVSCPTYTSPYSSALWSCLEKSRSKLAVVNSRTLWIHRVSSWVTFTASWVHQSEVPWC
jgi:hypothetical protein